MLLVVRVGQGLLLRRCCADGGRELRRDGRAVQALTCHLRIGGELAFTQPVYSAYLMNQVKGSLEGASSGFTLWNASNDYYMVTVPLGPVIQSQGLQRAAEPGEAEAAKQALSARMPPGAAAEAPR